MKILPAHSTLLVIDIQQRLLPKIFDNEQLLQNVIWTIDLAKTIGIPMILTEHSPSKIGTTPSIIRDQFVENDIITKNFFSAVQQGNLLVHLQQDRKQVIVIGTEAHICVQQTVLDLLNLDYQIFLLESCLGTRNPNDKEKAIERMKQNGAEIITADMLAFEWLEKAETELFRTVLNKFIK